MALPDFLAEGDRGDSTDDGAGLLLFIRVDRRAGADEAVSGSRYFAGAGVGAGEDSFRLLVAEGAAVVGEGVGKDLDIAGGVIGVSFTGESLGVLAPLPERR